MSVLGEHPDGLDPWISLRIGRLDDAERRFAFDLLGQRRTRCVGYFGMCAALPLEYPGSLVECIGQAGGREYDDILRMCRLTRAERDQRRDECGGQPSRYAHVVLPIALT